MRWMWHCGLACTGAPALPVLAAAAAAAAAAAGEAAYQQEKQFGGGGVVQFISTQNGWFDVCAT